MSGGRDDSQSWPSDWISVRTGFEPIPAQCIDRVIAQYLDG